MASRLRVRARTVQVVAVSAALALSLAACGSSSTSEPSSASDAGSSPATEPSAAGSGAAVPESVTLGASLPLTGPGAPYGEAMKAGLDAAIANINAAGGAGGTQLNVEYLDSKAEAGLAVSTMRQLVSSDGAVAVISAFTVPPLASLPVAEETKTPVLNGGGNDPSLAGHDWLFNNILSVSQEMSAALTYAKDSLGVKTLGIFETTAYTAEGLAQLEAAATKVLGTPPTTVAVDEAATDVNAQVDELLSTNPDAVFISVSGTALDLVAKALAARGSEIPILTGSQIFAGSESVKGPLATKIVAARQEYKPTEEFLAAFPESTIESPPSIYSGTYYSLGYMLSAAVANLNSTGQPITGENVQKQLNDLGKVDGCCGPVGFTLDHASDSPAEVVTFSETGVPTVVATIAAS